MPPRPKSAGSIRQTSSLSVVEFIDLTTPTTSPTISPTANPSSSAPTAFQLAISAQVSAPVASTATATITDSAPKGIKGTPHTAPEPIKEAGASNTEGSDVILISNVRELQPLRNTTQLHTNARLHGIPKAQITANTSDKANPKDAEMPIIVPIKDEQARSPHSSGSSEATTGMNIILERPQHSLF